MEQNSGTKPVTRKITEDRNPPLCKPEPTALPDQVSPQEKQTYAQEAKGMLWVPFLNLFTVHPDITPADRKNLIVSLLTFAVAAIGLILLWAQVDGMLVQIKIMQAQAESATAGDVMRDINNAKQIEQLRRQAEAAEKNVAAIGHQLRVDQRPWVGLASPIIISSIRRDQEHILFEYAIPIKNYGKSPALRVMATAGVVFNPKEIPGGQEYECRTTRKFADAKILQWTNAEGQTSSIDDENLRKIPPYLRQKWGMRNLKPIERFGTILFPGDISTQPVSFQGELKQTADIAAYFAGCIIYRDQFSDAIVHTTKFCQETAGRLDTYVPGTPLVHCNIGNIAN